MARILLTCWGSHGDVDPFLGLGLALRARGHSVVIATIEYFRGLITGAGLGFHPIRPDVRVGDTDLVQRILDRRTGSEFLLRELMFPASEAMFEDLDAASAGADLLVSHPLTFAAPVVAEARRLKWASAVLSPLSFFSRYDVPVFPPAPWLKSLLRFGAWPGPLLVNLARFATKRWQQPVYALRQRLGLPRGAEPIWDGQHSPYLVLALFSSVLARPQRDWPPKVRVTGHVFHDAPHGVALSPEIESFLGNGPPPIVFTLGSSVVLVAGDFWQESLAAVRRLGMRALLLTGPGRAEPMRPSLPPGVLAVDAAPHSLLFPRASVVVQQCGIGTLAQSLRSGRPMLGVPHAHDQPDNAWRVAQLGMARTLYPWKYRAARVATELHALCHQGSYSTAAERIATVVRSEGGVREACEALEQTFGLA
jgi:rhamnosyltransferase subunit B